MSGAEVLAVLGATSSVIAICETCAAIVRFIQKCRPSETTTRLSPQVCLLAQIITQLKPLYLESPAHDLNAVLDGCEKELLKLKYLLEEYQKASSATFLARARKSVKIPIWEQRIRENWTFIQQYQSTISLYLDFYNTRRLLKAPGTDYSLFLVPRKPTDDFVGRQDIFAQISNSINHSTQYPCVLSLTGLAAIGKTEIALQLCHQGKAMYSTIAWIRACSEAVFRSSVVTFANNLAAGERTLHGREDSLLYIRQVASTRTQPWLLVLDDWDFAHPEANPFEFMADGCQRDLIVMTTRTPRPSWGVQIQVPPLPEKESAELILYGTQFSSSVDEVKAARALARMAGYIPLTLFTASAHLRSKGCTPRQLVEELESSGSTEQMDAMTRVIRMSFQGIKREDTRLMDFLQQMSFIAVPAEFIFRDYFMLAQSRGEPLPTFYELFVHDQQWSSELFLHAVMRLSAYALVEKEVIGEAGLMVLSLHTLVRAALQSELLPPAEPSLGLQLIFHGTAIIASSLIICDWEELSCHHRRIFRENILECRLQRRISLIDSPDHVRRYSGIFEVYQTALAAFLAMYSNKAKLARDLLLESLSVQSTCLGQSAPLTCTTMTWLVLLYLERMSLEEAEGMINRLHTAESQAPKHQALLVPLVDVQFLRGHLQMRKQNIDQAAAIFQRCTDLYASIAGISGAGTVCALISGVEALLLQGHLEDAAQALYDAERIQKEIRGPRAFATRVKWNLARHSLRMGDFLRAASRYRDLCEEHENHHDQLGSSSRQWEALHCELGDVYLQLGDLQKANSEYDLGRAGASRRSRVSDVDSRDISSWFIHGSLLRTKFIPYERQ